MPKKSLSKEELIEQLKALTGMETPKDSIHLGAMCYSPALPRLFLVKCESCGKAVEEYDYVRKLVDINSQVKEIRALGYDVKVEHVCADCANSIGLTDKDGEQFMEGQLYYLFHFKTRDQEQYHIAESSDVDEYKAVLAFLKNEPTYTDFYDATHLVKDELDVIKKMTGISID